MSPWSNSEIENFVPQQGLAELEHLHRNDIGGVERGECNISLLNIVELAALHPFCYSPALRIVHGK